ncbi:MAG: TIGR03943 family protein [Micromonosporaceae bacterium]|nr:TIGR03943 family protein [Micromonosporaceae bacterium]
MRRYAQTALLVLLGGMLLKLVATNAHLRYVRAGYAPLLVLTGIALLAVAAVTLWRDLRADAITRDDDTTATGLQLDGIFGIDRQRAARSAREQARDAGGDHRDRALAAGRAAAAHEGLGEAPSGLEPAGIHAPTAKLETVRTGGVPTVGGRTDGGAGLATAPGFPAHSAGQSPGPIAGAPVRARTSVGWALLAAALAVLVLAPPALGSFPAVRTGALDPARSVGAIPDGDPVSMSLAEYAAHAAAGGQALAGRRVRLVGFVVAGPRGEPYLARLAMGCCAAGARPVKLGLTGDLPGVLTADMWVEVVGVYTDQVGRDPINGAPIPYISVVDVTPIDPPADPYES